MPRSETADKISLPGFVFDLRLQELLDSRGGVVPLRPQTRAVLTCLARSAGALVSKDELMNAAWPNVVVTEDSLVQCIGKLRRALGDDTHEVIQTESRRGYRLVSDPQANTAGSDPTAHGPEFHQQIGFATTIDGVRIAYAISGKGPPLVRTAHWMTHLDWDWRSATFGPRIQAFSRRFRFLRYDGRGHGLSDWDAQPGTLDEAVADLEAVVDEAGLERFALLGASSGASIAVRFAARHPQRVSHLVFLGGFARGALHRGQRSTPRESLNAMLRLLEDGWGQDNPAFRQLLTALLWPGANAEQAASFNQLQRVSCPPQTAAALMLAIANYDATEDLAGVRCPTIVLHSPRDSRIPFEESRFLASMIKGARLEPFDSPNHTPLVGEPAFEQVQHLIEAFLLDEHRPLQRDSEGETVPPLSAVAGTEPSDAAVSKARHNGA